MDEQPEKAREEMELTRTSLEHKLEALEGQVAETVGTAAEAVQTARSAVANTIEDVKEAVESVTETVQDTAASVGRTLNLRLQTERHPWLMFGGSIAVGCCVGYLLPWPRRQPASAAFQPPPAPSYPVPPSAPLERADMPWPHAENLPPQPQEPEKKSFLGEEIGQLKKLAIGSLMGLFRDVLVRELPQQLGQRLQEEMNAITTKLGGEPITEKLVQDEPQSQTSRPTKKGSEHNGGHNGGHKTQTSSVQHDRMKQGPPKK
jgi:ElaB/YqjD/DUF883 family membrane-anchored ribosome-binding protein